jgi:hypothetical protein
MGVIPYLACMAAVAATAQLPPRVLPAIAVVEGGAPGLVHPDNNGTADLGIMQINTIWIPTLAARAGITPAATRARLLAQPCFNIAAAALILRVYLSETDGALLPAIGDYHSHSLPLNRAYAARTVAAAAKLFGP